MAKNDIDIVVGAQDKASQVLRGVSSQVGSLSTSFASLGPAVVGIGAAIGGAVASFIAVKSAIEGVAGAANRIDALTDVATGLGESVGDLQAFQFALSEAGNVSPEKAITTLQKLSATIGSIASGENKAGAEVLKQLGLDAEQLALDGPIAQFEAIQGKLAEISNSSERAAIAQKLFGREAKDLLPALSVQTDSMRESAEYARKVGAAVSEEGAAGVASMNDAVGRLMLGFEGVFNQVAIAIAPAVEAIALTLADWLVPVSELVQSYLPVVVDSFAAILDAAIETAAMLGLMSKAEQTYAERIEQSRKAAAERARDLEDQRGQAKSLTIARPESVDDGAKQFESTLSALERQLAVLEISESYVRSEEQLATARNQQERERIELLQSQIFEQEKQIRLEEEAAKLAEDRAKKDAQLQKMLTPDATPQQAVQGRLLTKGTAGDPATQQLNVLKQINTQLQRQREEEAEYRRQKDRGFTVRTVLVP